MIKETSVNQNCGRKTLNVKWCVSKVPQYIKRASSDEEALVMSADNVKLCIIMVCKG